MDIFARLRRSLFRPSKRRPSHQPGRLKLAGYCLWRKVHESSHLALQRNFPPLAYRHHVEFTQSARSGL